MVNELRQGIISTNNTISDSDILPLKLSVFDTPYTPDDSASYELALEAIIEEVDQEFRNRQTDNIGRILHPISKTKGTPEILFLDDPKDLVYDTLDNEALHIEPEKEPLRVNADDLREGEPPPLKQSLAYRILYNVFFLIPVAAILFSVISFTLGGDGGKIVLGSRYQYTGFEAGAELASGSLIISKPVDSSSIHVDDTIVMSSEAGGVAIGTITEAITANSGGVPIFGLKNTSAQTVSGDKVIGLLKRRIPYIGSVMLFLKQNILMVITICVLLMIAFSIVNRILKEKNASKSILTGDEPAEVSPKKKRSVLISILIYSAMVVSILIAFVFSSSGGGPKNFFGYSYFTVLSGSMQREIPKGSLVITKHIDPNTIQVGDDITYIKSDTTTVTHRVVEIHENYEDSGVRGFRTKGLENQEADAAIVHAASVVGVVIFHTADVGASLSYIAKNLWMIIGLFAVFIALSFTLRMFLGEVRKGKPPKGKEAGQDIPGTS